MSHSRLPSPRSRTAPLRVPPSSAAHVAGAAHAAEGTQEDCGPLHSLPGLHRISRCRIIPPFVQKNMMFACT
jgi:hypothetical protein